MNISQVISHIKMQLGLYNITLPFKSELTGEVIPTEKVLHDVLSTVTIPTFSEYKPWIREHVDSLKNLRVIDKDAGIYMLPDVLTETEIMYVCDVSIALMNNDNRYNEFEYIAGINYGMQGVATAQAALMLNGQMRAAPTFEYIGYNKIKLFGYPRGMLSFKVACEHNKNGDTITPSCKSAFMSLAMLDVKMFLYNTLKMYNELPTAFGTINLKLDDYQSADGDRTALLKEWDDTFHLDMGWETFM